MEHPVTLRVALVGCGKIGSEFADDPLIKGIYSHAGAWCACTDADLVAICDTDPERLNRCGERHGVAARFDDLNAMLTAAQPDIVSICTPDETHAALLGRVIAAPGVQAVLMEKPLALAPDDAKALVLAAARHRVLLAVNYSRRYSPAHQALAQRLRTGEIGDIQSVCGHYTKGLLHNGTHWFDLARMLVGEMVSVTGYDRLQEAGTDPTIDVRVGFANGATGVLQALDAAAYSLFEMDIVGTTGRIRIVDSGHRFELFRAAMSPYYSGYRTLLRHGEESGGMEDSLLHAVQDLVEALSTHRTPLCCGEDAVAALAIGVAAHASARAGGTTLRL